jgi:hypothetical protein
MPAPLGHIGLAESGAVLPRGVPPELAAGRLADRRIRVATYAGRDRSSDQVVLWIGR